MSITERSPDRDTPVAVRGRSPGRTVQEIMDADVVPPPETLRREHPMDVGSAEIPVERYISREWLALEADRLWPRVWQMACREEELVEVGDTVVYDVADLSILLVRTEEGLRGYHNACLHRGTQLRAHDGYTTELRCPFHGWTWNLDGSLRQIPCEWDFPQVDQEAFCLPQVQVGTWGGWVFVNPDLGAPSLAEHLGTLPAEFPWDTAQRYKSLHVSKIMRCNWKTCMEAFMESYHVIATHPQILLTTGDANTQYDIYEGEDGRPGWNRMLTPSAVASPHLGDVDETTILQGMMATYGMGDDSVTVPEGMTARQLMTSMARSTDPAATPASIPGELVSDAEAIDSILYFIFPNMQPWAGMSPINYRFRPNGDDPDSCIMDVIFLSDFTGERPPPAEVIHLGPDDDWTMAEGLGALAMVFNQDTGNLPRVQRGLHATRRKGLPLGLYQESRLRQFQRDLAAFVERD
jgi:phenylpropionate dioxygenase-like ring-hydroxylating dioxygenase large terminal subunit